MTRKPSPLVDRYGKDAAQRTFPRDRKLYPAEKVISADPRVPIVKKAGRKPTPMVDRYGKDAAMTKYKKDRSPPGRKI